MKILALAIPFIFGAIQIAFAHDDSGFGQAGILSKKNHGEPLELLLSSGEPLSNDKQIKLKSGTYYELEITADGSQELALAGAGFFRAIWIDEIVIEGIEIRPLGVDCLLYTSPSPRDQRGSRMPSSA